MSARARPPRVLWVVFTPGGSILATRLNREDALIDKWCGIAPDDHRRDERLVRAYRLVPQKAGKRRRKK